jgi:hypothetical protein
MSACTQDLTFCDEKERNTIAFIEPVKTITETLMQLFKPFDRGRKV